MQYLLLEISKYILSGCIFTYATLSVVYFFFRHGNHTVAKSVISGFQNTSTVLISLFGFLHLYFYSGKIAYLAICLFLLLSLMLLLLVTTSIYPMANRLLLNNMAILFTSGLLMISRISVAKAVKQFIIFLFCFALCMVLPFCFSKFEITRKLKWVYAGTGLLMITTVLLLGEVTHGSKLSFTLFGITFQPSECVKILFIFFIACMLWENTSLKNIAISACICAAHIIVLVLSKDLGTALIFSISYILILVIATGNYLILAGGFVAFSLASVVAYKLFSHVRVRVNIWLDPWTDIDNKGYQIAQGLFSITSGGLFGTGLLKGTPTDIPFAETDFIFSAISEEMGLVYSISLLVICASSFAEMLRIASKIHDKYYQLLIYGIAVSLIFQVFLTVGGGTKFIPLTGVTLPLVSYGGTSFMVSMIMYFIVQSVYIKLRSKQENVMPFRFHKTKEKSNEKQ